MCRNTKLKEEFMSYSFKYKGKIAINSDNDRPELMGGFVSLDEEEEIQGFVPTRDELIQIVKYWAESEVDFKKCGRAL